jgi:hypothetical protein
MSDGYLDVISCAIDNVKRVIEENGDGYTVIVTATMAATTAVT